MFKKYLLVAVEVNVIDLMLYNHWDVSNYTTYKAGFETALWEVRVENGR